MALAPVTVPGDGAGAGAGAGAAAAADSATASASERLRLELAETAAARRHPRDCRRLGRRSTRYQTLVLGAADARGIVSTACDERATARSYTEAPEADQAQRRPLTYGRLKLRRHALASAPALALEGMLAWWDVAWYVGRTKRHGVGFKLLHDSSNHNAPTPMAKPRGLDEKCS